ncbi:MAG: hypothetical protein C0392_10215 [Syntrophus sp. (in: bacteria)]|nr:hypothetical protein [Syntrophus sp. (in: bacteria)]
MVVFPKISIYYVIEGVKMKKINLVIFVCLLIVVSVFGIAEGADDLKPEALKNLQKSVVKALPVEGNIVRIAVLDFKGDDGTVKNAVISIITEKTPFKVIERTDLDKILNEQGLQLRDVMDEKTRIRHGRLKGVQGLLMGKVQGMEKGFMSYTIKVHLKLDDVERGEIVFSKDFNVSAVSPLRKILFVVIAVFMAGIIVIMFLARRKGSIKESVISKDVKARADLTMEMNKALTIVGETKKRLMDKGRTDEAVLLKDAERDLLFLKESINNAARGNGGTGSVTGLKETLKFDKGFADSVQNLSRISGMLHDNVISGSSGSLEREIDSFRRNIKIAMNGFGNQRP